MASVNRMVRPGVWQRSEVKNLGWFFRHAREVVIQKFDMWQSNDGWEMFVDFADHTTFSTHYADLSVFKDVMNRQRSLKGVTVSVHRADGSVEKLVLGSREGRHRYKGGST